MQRAVGMGWAKRFTQSWPFHCPGGAGAGEVLARGEARPCPPPHARIRTLCPAARVFVSRRTTRRQCRVLARLSSCGGAGRNRPKRRPSAPRPGSTGTPPLVRIRTDTFLRREKCPRCRVRGCVSPGGRKRNGNAACGGAGPGEALFSKLPFAFARAARGPGSFAQNGRVPVRRRTRRFGHAALAPCSVFAPKRTTRRQRRALLGFHRAAGEEKPARAPPCPAGWNLRQNLLQWNHDTPRPRRARKGLRPVAARLSPALWPGRNTTPPPRLRAAAQRRI